MRVHLYPDFPEAGNPPSWRYLDNLSPTNYLPLDFLYTQQGWVPIEKTVDRFYAYDQPAGFSLHNIVKLSFRRATLHYRTEKRGKDTLEFLTTSTAEYVFVGRRYLCQTRDTLATFLLADSSLATLLSTFESSGTFSRSFSSSLVLAAGSSEKTLAEIWNGSAMTFSDSLQVEDKQWDETRMNWDQMYDDRNFNWTKIYSWENHGRSIVIDLGKGIRVRISWSDLGNDVDYSRL
jgi:hypothetical protein